MCQRRHVVSLAPKIHHLDLTLYGPTVVHGCDVMWPKRLVPDSTEVLVWARGPAIFVCSSERVMQNRNQNKSWSNNTRTQHLSTFNLNLDFLYPPKTAVDASSCCSLQSICNRNTAVSTVSTWGLCQLMSSIRFANQLPSEVVSNAGQPSKIPSQRVLWDNATAGLGPYGCASQRCSQWAHGEGVEIHGGCTIDMAMDQYLLPSGNLT